MEDTWISIITDIGFPVAVTFYLLHRIENKLNTLIESILSLPERLK
ncbi:YvrJ family protein [Paraliobacillus salinarum]|nr:YvrJ family protein [Paraliobacillus salinarum]